MDEANDIQTTEAPARCVALAGSGSDIPRTDAAISIAENDSQLVHNLAKLSATLEREINEAQKELRQLESLMFGGFLDDTPKTGIAWRVFDEVMAMKKNLDSKNVPDQRPPT